MDPAAAQAAAANPALADDLGQVLQIVVQGLIKVLQARSEIKDTFRLQHTRMRPQENNPLKFSPDSRAALSALFAQRVPGFLTPTETFQEAFADIEAHQMAMLAGMRAAFDNVMQRFDPESLEAEFNRDKGGGMFKPLNKARYWDKLVEMYGRQSSNSDESFRRLFGDAFAEAYEQQMQRLTATRRRR
jgi:type VI secretion system FHA domain protein